MRSKRMTCNVPAALFDAAKAALLPADQSVAALAVKLLAQETARRTGLAAAPDEWMPRAPGAGSHERNNKTGCIESGMGEAHVTPEKLLGLCKGDE